MSTDVVLPQLGETVSEGTIVSWLVEVGQDVTEGQPLVEVSTDKVDTEIESPVAGTLSEILVPEGETIDVGTLLARIGGPESSPVTVPAANAGTVEAQAPSDGSSGQSAEEPPSGRSGVLSPVVRRLIKENGLDGSKIVGTGSGGRITRSDVEMAISDGAAGKDAIPVPDLPAPVVAPPPVSATTVGVQAASGGATAIPMNNVRKRTGDHMVASKAISPHVLTAVEVDFERVERVRAKHKSSWKADEGSSLTYLPFICRAVVDGLAEYPNINATVGDGELLVHSQVNLAIAVDLDFNGLIAPVIRDANSKRLRAIARDISDLATRAKSKKLGADEIQGGTFTLTNPGQYGTLMQFPLINQPQVAILSTDGVRRKPVVVTDQDGNESIAIHSVGILALAWDHRAFDGAYVAAFLNKVREIIETRDWDTEIS